MTYNGLESCIINNQSYENESRTSRGDGCASDSLDDDFSSCSSSKDAFGSFSSKWMKRDEQGSDEWELSESPKHFYVKEKPAYSFESSDVETMKENFAKLLLGEDITGGRKGVSTALALSNAITNLAASIFGELWKLEPLAEERKNKWRREMDWLLSPTNYMVELVPAKQNGANGRTMEIMTPKARADIHMNLPALQKLDSMLIETLESMVNAQFYYAEVGSRAEGRNKSARESKRWWLPLPQVPKTGLSDTERQKLQCKGKVVYQVFKAAASINENVLLEIPLPSIIRDALPKSGKASLGDDLYKVLTLESSSVDEMFISLNLKSENNALEVINRLEAAVFAWKGRLTEQASGKSPVRKSWSFINPTSEMDKMELLVDRAEALLRQIKSAYPNLPQTFLDASKIQYGKDVGHSILEAYSRVLKNLAFSIMCRMGEILQEDSLCNPNSGVATWCFPGINVGNPRHSHSLSDVMNKVEGKYCESDTDVELYSDASINATPSTSRSRRVWCIGKEACYSIGVSP
ncbi:rop guanine nucleotide exchange factor 14 isoform X2 [Gossypium arboreum]|nr:rop guanine nucleotide exchange factor 14 isoform X2 [Gossypium arboreum]XP_052887809.1 rop guanine nucleotide exchange factor 14 isoform X2 [Gossypium arboreum]XP_052887810.1 rop guanine nucleotide exchange factor 14 isoform X2 [Gossypium arboreum]